MKIYSHLDIHLSITTWLTYIKLHKTQQKLPVYNLLLCSIFYTKLIDSKVQVVSIMYKSFYCYCFGNKGGNCTLYKKKFDILLGQKVKEQTKKIALFCWPEPRVFSFRKYIFLINCIEKNYFSWMKKFYN